MEHEQKIMEQVSDTRRLMRMPLEVSELITDQWSLSSSVQRIWYSKFSIRIFSFNSSDHRAALHFASVHFKWVLDLFLMQCPLRAQRPQVSKLTFSLYLLTQRCLRILEIFWGEYHRFKVFPFSCWGIFFWNCFNVFCRWLTSAHFFHIWHNHPI